MGFHSIRRHAACLAALTALPTIAHESHAQVDSARAIAYFAEAKTWCEAEAGRLWGTSLCGPIAFADPVTHTLATSEPAPDAPRPPALGYANAALKWGDRRWTIVVWQLIPHDDPARRTRLLAHELFHRVQPSLGFLLQEEPVDHLATLDGRYWMLLEFRGLARALRVDGAERRAALADALGFRAKRRARFPEGAEGERRLEVIEGLAQYTGTVLAYPDGAELNAAQQLDDAAAQPSLVRTFPYPLGAGYGVLLDAYAPGWTRRFTPADDIGALVRRAAGVTPTADVETAAQRYDGTALHAAEVARDSTHRALVAEYRRRFVEGPVLLLPAGHNSSFVTSGMTPIPDAGTIYPTFRTSSAWGSLEADYALMKPDRALAVPAPAADTDLTQATIVGDGWTLHVAEGWVIAAGPRTGDLRLIQRQ